MVSITCTPLNLSPISCVSTSSSYPKISAKQAHAFFLDTHRDVLLRLTSRRFGRALRINPLSRRGGFRVASFFNSEDKPKPNGDSQEKETVSVLPVLKRWDVPWKWQTLSLTFFACGLSFLLTGLVQTAAIPYLDIHIEELNLEEKAEILFLDQGITTAVVLGVLYSIVRTFQPLPEDVFRFDLREPFNLQRGWLLWAWIGLGCAIGGVYATGAVTSLFSSETPERQTDALALLLPLIGSSSISTACLLGITGVFAPVLEESVFRGFLLASLTKWVSTPVAIIVSAAAFALAHLTPAQFPQLFVLGTVLGISYAQTRNLLTPITIHALWNSGVILLLTFLLAQGYDIKELLQASQ